MSVATLLKTPADNWTNLNMNSLALTNGVTEFGGSSTQYQGTVTLVNDNVNHVYVTFPTQPNHCYFITFTTFCISTAGTHVGLTFTQQARYIYKNLAGVVTSQTVQNVATTNGISAGQDPTETGANIQLAFGGSTVDTLNLYWTANILAN